MNINRYRVCVCKSRQLDINFFVLWIQYLCHIIFRFHFSCFHALCSTLLYQQIHITFAYMNLMICKSKYNLAHDNLSMPLILKPSFKLFNWSESWDTKFIALIFLYWFSCTRASVATVISTPPCFSSFLRVKGKSVRLQIDRWVMCVVIEMSLEVWPCNLSVVTHIVTTLLILTRYSKVVYILIITSSTSTRISLL